MIDLKSQLNGNQVIAPLVYDCLTARMAENIGFRIFVLDRAGLAMTYGIPSMGLLTCDDIVNAASRICDFMPYPVIIDFGNGFSNVPYDVQRNTERLIRAQASAIIIDDSDGVDENSVVSEKLFFAKIAAAVKACKDTGCMVIAASNAKYSLGIDVCVKRLIKCRELGADIIMCRGLAKTEDCVRFASEVKGFKMLDDYSTAPDKQSIDLEILAQNGFNLISVRYLEKASLYGLMNYGLRCKADNDTVYVDYHDWDGTLPNLDHHLKLSDQWRTLGGQIRNLSVLNDSQEEGAR
jgi:2-methylisocitrate lyase-like PEP mutase family enzyme